MAGRLIVRPLAEADLENAARWYEDECSGLSERFLMWVAVFSNSVVSAGAGLQFFRAVNLAQMAVECAERQMTGLSGDFEKED
jgi:hypothetical protein